ncbi:MAG TPA: 30S ribosomal protein S11 [Candidatus Pacearchaeota archaeon]|nr:MAG: 30S ribosomal protein S11 [Candidatus Pacearchaeota archaeon ex4484_31]HDI03174.1 30S ribosomal protein S11 [Candidatus Pacearchaeota archaeon]
MSATKEKQSSGIGIVKIKATTNNTIVHITDLVGNTIARVSGGEVTKHDRLKANPTVAMFVAKRAAEKAKEEGINAVYVYVRGKGGKLAPTPGPGANAAIKSLAREGLKILNIVDVTPMPKGGPKPKGGKRGRRV